MMNETVFNAMTHDYTSLAFDIGPHKEALRIFDRYGYDAASVIATLIARDLIHRRMPHGKFRIDCAVDLGRSDSATFTALHRTSDAKEARLVKYEVERYFMRHFPGRCLNKIDDGQDRLPRAAKYVVFTTMLPSEPSTASSEQSSPISS